MKIFLDTLILEWKKNKQKKQEIYKKKNRYINKVVFIFETKKVSRDINVLKIFKIFL